MIIQDVLERDRKLIVDRIRSGDTTTNIAKDYNCNPGTVWYFLSKIGVKSCRKIDGGYGKLERQKEKIIILFDEGNSAYKIAQIIGASKSSVLKKIKEWGCDTSKKCSVDYSNLLKDKLDCVIELYKQGKSTCEIAKIVGHGQPSVRKLLLDNGCDTSRNKTKYDINIDFFDKINNEIKAYILGIVYADGSVNNKGRFRIALQERDKRILERIKQEIGYTGPLYYKKACNEKCQSQVELCVNRKKFTDKLIKLGCIPNKSLVLKFPTKNVVSENLLNHFIRGIFDGDGSLYIGRGQYIMFAGSYNFIYRMRDVCVPFAKIYQRYKDRKPEDSSHQLYIGKKQKVLEFCNWMYNDATIYLERKYKSYLKLLEKSESWR